MPTPLPDCTLDSLRASPPPARQRRIFLREAARACARYLREGGRLAEIQPEHSRFRHGRLELHPLPAGGRVRFPDRKVLEADLIRLEEDWRGVVPDDHGRLVFLMGLCRSPAVEDPAWRLWARCWVDQRHREIRRHIRYRYHVLFRQTLPDRNRDLNGRWEPEPGLDLDALRVELDRLTERREGFLSHSKRADVFTARVRGAQAVVKRFTANPRSWRRRWEVSRARRAWVGSRILREVGLNCAPPLGWLERRENGRLVESYFICGVLPTREDARIWMRRVLPRLAENERVLLRHRLRGEIIRLQHHALCHVDLKLSNLLVDQRNGDPPTFYWIDLEDIRPGQASFRTIIRNFYQLNGSLPRQITRDERLAFAAGFRRFHPLAVHRVVLAYVERKTQKRLRSELRRLTSA